MIFLFIALSFFHIFIYLFLFLAVESLLLLELFLVVASRGYSLVVVHGLLIAVASLVVEHGALGQEGFSSCGSQALEHRLNSCGTWALLL